MKFSYIIPTAKPNFCSENVIEGILKLPTHEFEIILISTGEDSFNNIPNFKFIKDTKKTGSVSAINEGYKQSSGDIIIITPDDHTVPENFLDIKNYLNSKEFNSKKIKLGNLCEWMGGPGKDVFYKKLKKLTSGEWHVNTAYPKDHTNQIPYQIIAFPVLEKATVENELNGVIFNECFLHHYPDHWLGAYSEYINKEDDIGPKDVFMTCVQNHNDLQTNFKTDPYDKEVFLKLMNRMKDGINYNCKI